MAYGVYYAVQYNEVTKIQREYASTEQQAYLEQGKQRRAESKLLEQESLIKALQQQADLERTGVKELEKQLESTRLKVHQLESQVKEKVKDLERIEKERQAATGQIERAKAESKRHKEAATLAEQSLKLLELQVQESKAKLNPLHHPLVKQYFNR